MASKRTTKCNWAGCIFAIEYLCPDIAKALVLLKAHRMRHKALEARFLEGMYEMTTEEGSLIPIKITEHTDQPSTEALMT